MRLIDNKILWILFKEYYLIYEDRRKIHMYFVHLEWVNSAITQIFYLFSQHLSLSRKIIHKNIVKRQTQKMFFISNVMKSACQEGRHTYVNFNCKIPIFITANMKVVFNLDFQFNLHIITNFSLHWKHVICIYMYLKWTNKCHEPW